METPIEDTKSYLTGPSLPENINHNYKLDHIQGTHITFAP